MGIMDQGIRHRNLALESFRNLAEIDKQRQQYEMRYEQEKEQLEAAEDARRSQAQGNLTAVGGIAGWQAAPKIAGMFGKSGVEKAAEAGLSKSAGAFLEGGKAGAAGLEAGLKSGAAKSLASSVSPGLLSSGGTTAALSSAAPAAVTTQSLAPALGATEIGGSAAELFGTAATEAIGAGTTVAGTSIGSAAGSGAGAATGAMEGQMAIPVPVLGALAGAGIGMLFGNLF